MKIGICTMFHENRNYGGILQALALKTFLNDKGYNAELIKYSDITKLHLFLSSIRRFFLKKDVSDSIEITINIKEREKVIDLYKENMSKSKIIYKNNLNSLNKEYGCFIAGSDQVWNPKWINDFYSLGFAKSNKQTVSYAASTGTVNYTKEELSKISNALLNTKHISIREKESIAGLKDITKKDIKNVLDPTLLLDETKWSLLSSPRMIKGDYIFCYFLSNNDLVIRENIAKLATKEHLKIVTIPYMNGSYRECDKEFGDFQLYKVNPADFLSLIKYSSFVVTDSYHGCIFSHIFNKSFIGIGNENPGMWCRMETLSGLFSNKERFYSDYKQINLNILEDLFNKKDAIDDSNFKKKKIDSIKFLDKALSDLNC